MSIFSRETAKNKFSGNLYCPNCVKLSAEAEVEYNPDKQGWKLDRYITPTLVRYICKKCKTPIRYDISNRVPSGAELIQRGLIR